MIHHPFQSRRAMTLIELLLVSMMIGMIGVAIYQSLSLGLQVWQRSQDTVVEQDIALFFGRLSADLHNAVYYSKFPADGGFSEFSFPLILLHGSVDEDTNETGEQLGRVKYEFESYNKRLVRREAGYGAALNNQYPRSQILISNIEAVKFRYLYISERGENSSDLILETFPASVEVTITLQDQLGYREMKKYIDLPLSL